MANRNETGDGDDDGDDGDDGLSTTVLKKEGERRRREDITEESMVIKMMMVMRAVMLRVMNVWSNVIYPQSESFSPQAKFAPGATVRFTRDGVFGHRSSYTQKI